MSRRRKLDPDRRNHLRELYAIRQRLLAQADELTLPKLAQRFGVAYSTAHSYCHGLPERKRTVNSRRQPRPCATSPEHL